MDRVRRAGLSALVGILFVAVALGAGGSARGTSLVVQPAAAVSWPPSTSLLLAEVVTGGSSASDEWIELANAGSEPVDLAGLEVVYVTSSGGTLTRKVSWDASLILEPGRHMLLANASGTFAAAADATYSGGLAAAGGSLVVRPIGGSPIDAVGWGDAVNAFVEGTPAPAPPSGSSIERRPGDGKGNTVDTNDGASDWIVDPNPRPEGLGDAPVPSPSLEASVSPEPSSSPEPNASVDPSPDPTASPSPSPATTLDPSPTADPSGSPWPSADPSVPPSPIPNPSPTPSSSPAATPTPTPPPPPSPSPTPTPTQTPAPSLDPSAEPDPSPVPSPTPVPALPIALARTLPDGALAIVEGTLTTALGALEGSRSGFVQDGTAGLAVYLDAAVVMPEPAGTVVRLAGTVGDRYGQRTLRVALADVTVLGSAPIPAPLGIATGSAGEATEGLRVAIAGTVVETPGSLSDGLGVTVDDGSGSLRAVVAPAALGTDMVVRGDRVAVVGPLGQRDSTGTGTTGYRVLATDPGAFALLPPEPSPEPSPSPSASPSETPVPSPTTSPTPAPSASAGPSPTPIASAPPPDPPLIAIAVARTRPIGVVVHVAGVVTAESGRLGKPVLLSIEDETAGLIVRLPDGSPAMTRGMGLEVTGKLAAPYGQLEIRPEAAGVRLTGTAPVPSPLAVVGRDVGEAVEARLVVFEGIVLRAPTRATSGDLTFDARDDAGTTIRVMTDASSGIVKADPVAGTRYRIVGVVGQRASRVGTLDGYRVWLRDRRDLVRASAVTASPSPSPSGGPSPDPDGVGSVRILPIAAALVAGGETVAIEGTVIADPSLLDSSGRRIVMQDSTGAVEVLLPEPRPVAVGDGLRVIGVMGTAYGAPRSRATDVVALARGVVRVHELTGVPGAGLEWQLVRVRGRVAQLHRSGDRWTADLEAFGSLIPITGLPGAGVPVARIAEGATIMVTGIVRRPYPTATDRRFAVVPRSPADVVGASTGDAGTVTGPASGADPGGVGGATGHETSPAVDVEIGQLPELVGQRVRIGGRVVELAPYGALLDDLTARAWIVLAGEATGRLGDLGLGRVVTVTGVVTASGTEARLIVEDPAGIELAPDLAAASGGPVASDGPGPGALVAENGALVTFPGSGPTVPVMLGAILVVFVGTALVARILRQRTARRRGATVRADRVQARLAALLPPALGDRRASIEPAAADAGLAHAQPTLGGPRPGSA